MITHGVLLAGGRSTRLFPATSVLNKHLLPIYDKPMIFYPLSNMICEGVRFLTLVVNPYDLKLYKELLGDGARLGIKITYVIQNKPKGIAHALQTAIESNNELRDVPLILGLGDNVFSDYYLRDIENDEEKANIFVSPVSNPSRYGVLIPAKNPVVIPRYWIEEKPDNPISNDAVVGFYVYPADVYDKLLDLKPSDRGEYEVTDLNNLYIDEDRIKVTRLSCAWLDTGTPESMLQASNFIQANQNRTGEVVGSPEMAAFLSNLVSREKMEDLVKGPSTYYKLLKQELMLD